MRTRDISIICIIIIFSLLLCACSEKEVQNEIATEQKIQVEENVVRDKTLQFDTSVTSYLREEDNISINADVVIPDVIHDGKVWSASGSPLPLRETTEDIIKEFFSSGSNTTLYFDETKPQFFSLEDHAENGDWTVMGYNDSAGFILNSKLYQHYQNSITTETFSELYNAQLYQKQKELDFMSQEQAVANVRNCFKHFGINLGDVATVYVMDYETMQQEEDITTIDGTIDASLKKESWSSADDTYYFYFYQDYQGIPVTYNPYTGQGWQDGEAATIMYNASGVIHASIQGCYEWTEEECVEIISVEEATDTLFRNYQGIVNTSYEVNRISFMMDIMPGADYTARLIPVWVFDTVVSGDGYTFTSKIVIDAVSGEELTA